MDRGHTGVMVDRSANWSTMSRNDQTHPRFFPTPGINRREYVTQGPGCLP